MMKLEQWKNVWDDVARYIGIAIFSSVMVVTCHIGIGSAQDGDAATQNAAAMDFHISAQPLGAALNAFAVTSGWQISASSELTAGTESPGVIGSYTPEQGLKHLLSGTGLTYRMDGPQMATIHHDTSSGVVPAAIVAGAAAGAATGAAVVASDSGGASSEAAVGGKPVKVPEVVVKDVKERPHREELLPEYAGGDVATGGRLGVLGNRDIMDSPFNQTNYSSKVIQNQQIRYMADVLNNDPTARASASTSTGADDFSIRGFNVSNADIYFNGMVGVAPTFFNSMMAESLERVEVLKGPSALLNGIAQQGSIGGTINLVPKRAGADPLTQFTGSYISSTQFGGHADISRRFGSEKQFGVRFNGVYRNGDTPIDYQSRESALGTLALDYQVKRFRVVADLGYQYQNMQAIRDFTTVSSGVQVPKVPNNRGNYDGPHDFNKPQVYYGDLRTEYDILDQLTVFAAVGGSYRNSRYVLTNRNITDAAGDLEPTSMQLIAETMAAWTVEGGLQGRFVTGPVRHQATLAYTYFNRFRKEGSGPFTDVPQSNIYNPTFGPAPDTSVDPALHKIQDMTLTGTTLADTLSMFDERLQLTVAGRLQTIDNTRFTANTGSIRSTYYESAVTPMVGLVVKPWQRVSLYANYIQGLQQGPVAPLTSANAGEIFAPFVTTQYEFGGKVDFGRLGTSLAFYQIAQPSGFVNPTTNVFGINGEQRHRGMDFNIFGELTEGVRLLGGAAFIDSELTKTEDGLNDGHRGIAVPRWRFVLGGEWDTPFLSGFTLFARGTHNTSMFLDQANTQEVPGWARLDLGARYMFLQPNGKPVTIRANVTNVLDSGYWDANSFGQLTVSDPRVFWLSATIDF